MVYPEILQAKFLERPNRFIARVDTGVGIETVHVKNTGRCRELLLPNVPVILAKSGNPNRRTQDDDPMMLAQHLKEVLGRKKAPVTVKTSKSFTIAGNDLTGVFVIKKAKDEFGNVGDSLLPVDKKAGEKGPWTIPGKSGDYYIGVEPDYESEDAVVLCYIRMTVKP